MPLFSPKSHVCLHTIYQSTLPLKILPYDWFCQSACSDSQVRIPYQGPCFSSYRSWCSPGPCFPPSRLLGRRSLFFGTKNPSIDNYLTRRTMFYHLLLMLKQHWYCTTFGVLRIFCNIVKQTLLATIFRWIFGLHWNMKEIRRNTIAATVTKRNSRVGTVYRHCESMYSEWTLLLSRCTDRIFNCLN